MGTVLNFHILSAVNETTVVLTWLWLYCNYAVWCWYYFLHFWSFEIMRLLHKQSNNA